MTISAPIEDTIIKKHNINWGECSITQVSMSVSQKKKALNMEFLKFHNHLMEGSRIDIFGLG